jgi:hypothetical protein
MKEIIQTALYNCARKYAKGFSRWLYLWEEKTTFEQQAEALSRDLEENGYVIIKRSDIKPLND